ncbi:MAG: hypothetical protein ABIJ61_05185 [bacterium]
MAKGKTGTLMGGIAIGALGGIVAGVILFWLLTAPDRARVASLVESQITRAENLLREELYEQSLLACEDLTSIVIQSGDHELSARVSLISGACKYSMSVHGSEDKLREAIVDFQQALQYYTPQTDPVRFSLASTDLANSKREISAIRQVEWTLDDLISIHRGAVDALNAVDHATLLSRCLVDMGASYVAYYSNTRESEYRDSALACIGRALSLIDRDKDPKAYADAIGSRGRAYMAFGQFYNRTENLRNSVEDLSEAIGHYGPAYKSSHYVPLMNSLGEAYRLLAESSDSAEICCDRSIAILNKALANLDYVEQPVLYATVLWTRGNTYLTLSEIEGRIESVKLAIDSCFKPALEILTPVKHPLDYAVVCNSLGFAYASIGSAEQDSVRLLDALEVLGRGLDYCKPSEYPNEYALLHTNRAIAYLRLCDFSCERSRLDSAISALNMVLTIRTPASDPHGYQSSLINRGVAFYMLQEQSGENTFYDSALSDWEEAAKYVDKSDNPVSYAEVLNNIGFVYIQSAMTSQDSMLILTAKQRLVEALQTAVSLGRPEIQEAVEDNLGRVDSLLRVFRANRSK